MNLMHIGRPPLRSYLTDGMQVGTKPLSQPIMSQITEPYIRQWYN